MRLLIITLVGIGVGLTAWLLLRGDDSPGPDADPVPPKTWWLDALGSLTSPLATAAAIPAQTVELSQGDVTLRIPPGKGPRVVRIKWENGLAPISIRLGGGTLYLVPETGMAPPLPCPPKQCAAARGKGTLSVPDEGGDVILTRTPGGRVHVVP